MRRLSFESIAFGLVLCFAPYFLGNMVSRLLGVSQGGEDWIHVLDWAFLAVGMLCGTTSGYWAPVGAFIAYLAMGAFYFPLGLAAFVKPMLAFSAGSALCAAGLHGISVLRRQSSQ